MLRKQNSMANKMSKKQIGWILIIISFVWTIFGFLIINWNEWFGLSLGKFLLKKAKIWHKKGHKKICVFLPENCVQELYSPFLSELPWKKLRAKPIKMNINDCVIISVYTTECKKELENVIVNEVPNWATSYNWRLSIQLKEVDISLGQTKIPYWKDEVYIIYEKEGIYYRDWLILSVILAFIGIILIITSTPRVNNAENFRYNSSCEKQNNNGGST